MGNHFTHSITKMCMGENFTYFLSKSSVFLINIYQLIILGNYNNNNKKQY